MPITLLALVRRTVQAATAFFSQGFSANFCGGLAPAPICTVRAQIDSMQEARVAICPQACEDWSLRSLTVHL